MGRQGVGTIDRRMALGGGFAAAMALAWPRAQIRGRVITQRGVAGGGQVEFGDGTAEFSLFASSVTGPADGEESEPAFLGVVHWFDGSVGLTFDSVSITNYENLDLSTGEGRRVEGVLNAGESGEQPFSLEVFFDLPESEPDRVDFNVGLASGVGAATPAADTEFTYTAIGDVTIGNIQGADFAVNPETGEVTDPGPA